MQMPRSNASGPSDRFSRQLGRFIGARGLRPRCGFLGIDVPALQRPFDFHTGGNELPVLTRSDEQSGTDRLARISIERPEVHVTVEVERRGLLGRGLARRKVQVAQGVPRKQSHRDVGVEYLETFIGEVILRDDEHLDIGLVVHRAQRLHRYQNNGFGSVADVCGAQLRGRAGKPPVREQRYAVGQQEEHNDTEDCCDAPALRIGAWRRGASFLGALAPDGFWGSTDGMLGGVIGSVSPLLFAVDIECQECSPSRLQTDYQRGIKITSSRRTRPKATRTRRYFQWGSSNVDQASSSCCHSAGQPDARSSGS